MFGRAMACAALLSLGAPALADDDPAGEEQSDERRFEVRVEATEIEVNTRGSLGFVVAGDSGFSIDEDYPAKLSFVPEVGDEVLAAAKTDYGREDAQYADDDATMRWEVEMMARKAGEHPVRLEAKFRLCREQECIVRTSKLRVKIVVKGS